MARMGNISIFLLFMPHNDKVVRALMMSSCRLAQPFVAVKSLQPSAPGTHRLHRIGWNHGVISLYLASLRYIWLSLANSN